MTPAATPNSRDRAPQRPPHTPRFVLTIALAVAVAATLGAAAAVGVLAAPVLADPGVVTRVGLPLVVLARDVAGTVCVGAALLAATCLPRADAPDRRKNRELPAGMVVPLVRLVTLAASAWAVASLAHLVFAFSDVSATGILTASFGSQLLYAATSIPLFQYFTTALVCVVFTSLLAAGNRSPVVMAWVAAVGALAWFSISLTGHAAGAGNHEIAVSAWWLHILAACVWLGGIVALVVMGPAAAKNYGKHYAIVVQRFSELALVAALMMIASGISSAALRLASFADLATYYGGIVILKVAGTSLLVTAGWLHRRTLIAGLRAGHTRAAFARLLSGELLTFGAIMGFAAVLSRTAPPVPDDEVLATSLTPAEIVTGEKLPPPPGLAEYFTQWQPDFLWIVLIVLGVERYVRAMRNLKARGDAWPIWRAVCWVIGMLIVGYLLNGAPAVYGRVLFSAHMTQHMLLSMTVPMLLVLGAPVMLLLRTARPRTDGSMGWREYVVAVIGSRWVKFFSNPIVAAINFTGSIIAFYFSPLFAMAISTHVGHILMTVHFVLAGYMFAEVLIGHDPGIRRPTYPMRLMLLFATMAFHAFFGVTLTSSDTVLAATYFSTLGWGIDLVADQQYGGALAWGIGEIPTLLLAVGIAFAWYRDDSREAKRRDRRVDRDGDVELDEYNRMLAERSKQIQESGS